MRFQLPHHQGSERGNIMKIPKKATKTVRFITEKEIRGLEEEKADQGKSYDLSLMESPNGCKSSYWLVTGKTIPKTSDEPLEQGIVYCAKGIYFLPNGKAILCLLGDDFKIPDTLEECEQLIISDVNRITPFKVETEYGDFELRPIAGSWFLERVNVSSSMGNNPADDSHIDPSYSVKRMLVGGRIEAPILLLYGDKAILMTINEKTVCSVGIGRVV